ncbi:MAG: hypothetical protein ACO1TE_24295 [Prosthecobacter sp.]
MAIKNEVLTVLKVPLFLLQYFAPIAHYLYLTRISWLALLAMTALPVLAAGDLRTLVLGAYDVQEGWEAGLIGFTLVLANACLFRCRKLVDINGPSRFTLATGWPLVPTGLHGWWLFISGLCLFFNAMMVLRASSQDLAVQLSVGLVAGGGIACIFGWILAKVEAWLAAIPLPFAPFKLFMPVGAPGLVIVAPGGKVGLAPGHTSLLIYGVALILAFFLVPESLIHPLASVLLLITLLALVLSFLAFVMDRYRVPVLVCVVAFCTVMNLYLESDHYYRVWGRDGDPFASPAQVVGAATKPPISKGGSNNATKRPIVIVTAAGGGIQSAAWTTRVLFEIEKQMKEAMREEGVPEEKVPGFHQAVRLVSGVSGGSVGALQYVHAFDGDTQKPETFQKSAEAASGSSLRSAVLGLVRDDLLRAVFPMRLCVMDRLYVDRGLLLQNKWSDNAAAGRRSSLADASLTEWGAAAAALLKPAVIFNSTIVETGERMAISTVPRRPPPEGTRRTGNFEFTERYKADLHMVTGARLSATFPLVSPAARPGLAEGPKARGRVIPGPEGRKVFPDGGGLLHAVDGGYFENSGMVGALEWLDEALQDLVKKGEPQSIPEDIVILELSAFEHPGPTGAAVDAGQKPGGTLEDLISPALTIANVRNSGQASFSHQLLSLFKERWGRSGAIPSIKIHHIPIYPEEEVVKKLVNAEAAPCEDEKPSDKGWLKKLGEWFFIKPDLKQAPLSWHLREKEIEQINTLAALAVQKALAGLPDDPSAQKLEEKAPGALPQEAGTSFVKLPPLPLLSQEIVVDVPAVLTRFFPNLGEKRNNKVLLKEQLWKFQ